MAVLAALICAAAPQVALAGSLLSGYGGPGEGSQALIGATLVNGSRGGGGGDGGSSTGSGRPSLAEPATSSTRTDTGGESHASSSSGRSSRQPKRSSGRSSNGSSTSGSGASSASAQSASHAGFASYPSSERIVEHPASFVLGASASDFAYALIALLCLLLTALATSRLARRSSAAGVER